MNNTLKEIQTPISDGIVEKLHVGDMVYLSGKILCGRDAVLPRIVRMCKDGTIGSLLSELQGGVIFHTAVSPAGVGPTSSNKLEIESSIGPLSKAGVKLHLGKGAIHAETVKALEEFNAVYAVIKSKVQGKACALYGKTCRKYDESDFKSLISA